MSTVRIGARLVGVGQPCFVAAEIGMNHNGDLDLAHRLIDAAEDAGVDAVKFQSYRTEDFVSDRALTYEYVSQGATVVESQYEMFKRCELAPGTLLALREHCDRRGIVFFSTPTSEAGIAELVRLGAPVLKNGSDYLVHLPLIRAMARTGLPTVLSVGMGTLAEIDDAVRAFREAGGTELILLHCTSSYPVPAGDVHLRKIPILAATFGCPVGFSDHSCGIVAALGAVSLGACFIEKHFTLNRELPGPDHRFSADPVELCSLVKAICTLEESLGDSEIGPTPSEMQGRRDFRLSCVAARDLSAGACLSDADVKVARPGTGLPPRAREWIIGRRLGRGVPAGKPFEPADLA